MAKIPLNSRKGLGVEYLIGGILAAVILFVIFSFAYNFYTGQNLFVQLLPSFAFQPDKVEGPEKLRYVIKNDVLQYYDGVKWKNFQQRGNDFKISLNDKVISYQETIKAFRDYYYQKRSGEVVSLTEQTRIAAQIQQELYDRSKYVARDKEGNSMSLPVLDAYLLTMIQNSEEVKQKAFWRRVLSEGLFLNWKADDALDAFAGSLIAKYLRGPRDYQRGDSVIVLIGKGEQAPSRPYGVMVLDNNDALYFQRLKEDLTGLDSRSSAFMRQNTLKEPYMTIQQRAIVWRNSVLKQPVEIGYKKDVEGAATESVQVCVIRREGNLEIDLQEPAAEGCVT